MATAAKTENKKEAPASQDLGLLRGRFKILLNNPLPQLDSAANRAYVVDDRRDPNTKLYAVISEPGTPFREELAQNLTARSAPGMVELHSHGLVKFGNADYRYAFVFDRPSESHVYSDQMGPLSEQEVLGKIVPRIIDTIVDMSTRRMTHRSIRADNLFYMDEGKLGFVLGECVTMPPAALQPAVYEPLESANALPHGRGDAETMSDIYAMGVLIVHLLGGVLPGEGKTREELYSAKLQQGTYAVLVPKIPASARTGFLLAGLLNDDPSRRWSVDVLKRWREGVYERPRPGFGDKRAPGPLVFEEVEYVSPRLLALALTRRPSQGYAILDNGKLESWVNNSLNDKDAGGRLNEIVSRASGTSRGLRRNEIQAISRASAILDFQGSIWYRDATFAKGGLSTLIAFAFRDNGPLKSTLAELMESGQLLEIIYSDQSRKSKEKRKDESWLKIGVASECHEYLEKRDHPGFGIERCLYELNPSVTCLSPVLDGAHVVDAVSLLELLEVKALKTEGKFNPFDRHTAAFIASRAKSISKHFQKLSMLKPDSVDHTLTLIAMFARMQNLMNPGPMPGMCLWVGRAIMPIINKIHSDIRKEFVKSKFEKVKDSGNLEKILIAIDLKNNLSRDEKEYEQAIRAFSAVEHNISALESGTEVRKFSAQRYGQWIASLLSISALLTSMGLSYLYFM